MLLTLLMLLMLLLLLMLILMMLLMLMLLSRSVVVLSGPEGLYGSVVVDVDAYSDVDVVVKVGGGP